MKKIHQQLVCIGYALIASVVCYQAAGSTGNIDKVIFVGNSLTQHAPNVAKLDWEGNHGMAASAKDKDYVHLFLARLGEEQGSAPEYEIYAMGGGDLAGQMGYLTEFATADVDLAVVQMGENDKLEDAGAAFRRDYERILNAIREGNPDCTILCFGIWSPPQGNTVKDAIIRELCEQYDARFVNMQSVNAEPKNQAGSEGRFAHTGVNWHPGDRGMEAMADALWRAYANQETAVEFKPVAREAWSMTEDWPRVNSRSWRPYAPGGDGTARIEQESPGGSNMFYLELPHQAIKGGDLRISTGVKAEGISEKPNPWNGIKVMVRIENAEGEMDYPQYRLPVGSFDWTEIDWNVHIPDNTVSARLSIGLENVTGVVEVGPIELKLIR